MYITQTMGKIEEKIRKNRGNIKSMEQWDFNLGLCKEKRAKYQLNYNTIMRINYLLLT